jgi:hypothetical protein
VAMTPSRGYIIELATALVIVVGSRYGGWVGGWRQGPRSPGRPLCRIVSHSDARPDHAPACGAPRGNGQAFMQVNACSGNFYGHDAI